MPRGYQKTSTTIYLMNYHFVWSPRYRRKLLVGKVAKRLEHLIYEKAKQLECRVIQLGIMPDHVHLFIESNPRISPNRVIGEMKGYTSRVLRHEFPELLRMPTLWTRSYFASTAENVSSKIIEEYIEAQKGA
ncbi:MAG: IS200/IS605 family transposase [Promethearchaeati archaeon SRVP18_Atabeyarchaeia-1]